MWGACFNAGGAKKGIPPLRFDFPGFLVLRLHAMGFV